MAFTKVTDNLLSSGVGTGAGNILELDSSGKLPAVDGSAVTSLTSSNLTGALPALDGSAVTSLTSSNLTGALPALDGSALTGVGVDGIVSTANATAITIDSFENVGIGTSSPTTLSNYHTVSVNGTSGSMLETMIGGTRTANIQSSSTETHIQTRTNTPIIFDTNNTERLKIGNDGTLWFKGKYNAVYSSGVGRHVYNAGSISIADDSIVTINAMNIANIIIVNFHDYSSIFPSGLFHCNYYTENPTIISNLDNRFANSDTDGKMCVYSSRPSSNVYIKNRMGSTKNVSIFILELQGV
jgi:hypothetical protein